jgi:hypothetical protein
MAEMGAAACDMLTEMIQKGRRRIARRRIEGKLILRESFRVPPDVLETLKKEYKGMIQDDSSKG